MQKTELDPAIQKRVQEWLKPPFDEKTRSEVQDLIKQGTDAVRDAFFTSLSFGTGGMRGIMGAGTTRINTYTIRMATQGLANYIKKHVKGEASVFVGFDSRHNSKLFADETAQVLAGNGIKVYLLKELRPTPFISFGTRQKKCTAGVMITASHNPKEYNGYKVYWSDGGQVVFPHDEGIAEEAGKVDIKAVKRAEHSSPFIIRLDNSLDQEYIKAIHPLQMQKEQNHKHGKELQITYTSLHGTGFTLAPPALKDWGFPSLHYVESQIKPDGDFPTVKFPNPEFKETLQLGLDTLLKTKSDILLANDPDADRVGFAAMHHGKAVILTGNEIASICTDYICHTLLQRNALPENGAFVTTIVSTDLIKTIANSYKRECFEVLTGFKFIGEMIHKWEKEAHGYKFLFGAEESYGFLIGTHSRDKDAIVSSCLISEIALSLKLQGKTMVDALHAIYKKHGIFREGQLSMNFKPGKEGMDEMASLMLKLHKTPPTSFLGKKVEILEDYETGIRIHIDSGKKEKLTLPKSDVLLFRLSDKSKLVIRPSGTEPKIKIYAGVQQKLSSIEEGIVSCDKHLNELLNAAKEDLKK